MTLKIMPRAAGSRFAGKKLLLIIPLSLLLLSLSQVALAEETCITVPTTDQGCTSTTGYSCIDTLIGFNADNFICDKPCTCTDNLVFPVTNRKCCKPKPVATNTCAAPNRCDTAANCTQGTTYDICDALTVCCKVLPACAAPNSCASVDDCGASDRLPQFTCTQTAGQPTQHCCKPACIQCVESSAGCSGGYDKVTDPNKFRSCGTGKICCELAGGGGAGGVGGDNSGLTGKEVDLNDPGLSPVGNLDIPTLIGYIVQGALGIIGSLALIFFVYGGFIMMISQGDAAKITKGKTTMVWAAVGIMIIFGSYIFVSYIITGLTEGSGGSTTDQTCGLDAYEGYSCQAPSTDLICQTGLCPGSDTSFQCCKEK